MGLGLSCFVLLSAAAIRLGEAAIRHGAAIYVLFSAAIWAWVSAALCHGLCSFVGLGLSCFMSWPLQQLGLALCSYMYMGLGLSCYICWYQLL